MEVNSRNFPNRLQMHRKIMRYKQKDVAHFLGIKAPQLSKWENGSQSPDIFTLLKLSILYRVLPNELYCEQYQEFKKQSKAKELELLRD